MSTSSRIGVVTLASALLLLQACASAPTVQQLTTAKDAALREMPDQFPAARPGGHGASNLTVSSTQTVTAWWETLNDHLLSNLVQQAAAHNHDVELALQNLALARNAADAARLNFRPQTNINFGANRQRLADASGLPASQNRFTAWESNAEASWEIDVFNRLGHAVDAAESDAAAAQADVDAMYVTVVAEIASSYIQLRGLQQRLKVNRQHAENLRQSYELTRQLMNAGAGDAFDIQRSLAQLELVQASLPTLESAIDANIYRLSVLTGQPPEALYDVLSNHQPMPSIPPSIAIGDPWSLMQRRPDIRRAEYQLDAALSRYQMHVSELYPRISISGTIGFLATRLADLGTGGTFQYIAGPQVQWHAFDMGRVKNQLEASDIQAHTQLTRFEKTVLEALEDVESGLAALKRETERQVHLRAAAEASAKATAFARQRYEVGTDSFLDVLDAQRTQLEAEDLLTRSEMELALNLITVYKALGGGWETRQ